MKIAGYQMLRRGVQKVRNRVAPRGLILLYHRVAEVDQDPWRLCVSQRHFSEHLAVIREFGSPLGLGELVRRLLANTLPRRAIVVTFDDGYADNLYSAKPLLAQQAIPATMFITTGMIGKNQEFWWDELDRILLKPTTLPPLLSLTINGTSFQWKSDEGPAADGKGERSHWCPSDKEGLGARHRFYRSVYHFLFSLATEDRQGVLDKLVRWSRVKPQSRPTYRSMSYQELSKLADEGLIDVGAHTVSHPALSNLSASHQEAEIRRSKTDLQDVLGRPITSFAYPFGRAEDYTAETAALVRQAGFACACSTRARPLRRDDDVFDLPRFTVPDWNGEKFSQWLSARLSA